MYRAAILSSLTIVVAGCSTLSESVTPGQTSGGYAQTKNSQGETVYRRERDLRAPPRPTPTPEPVVIAEPTRELLASPVESSVASSVAPSPADSASARSPLGLGIEFSSEKGLYNIGVNAMYAAEFFDARIGVSFFKGGNDLYSGFDLGVRPKLRMGAFAIFAGMGVYAGDAKTCTTRNLIEVCEKKFLYAGYGELGVSLKGLSVFARSYNIEEAGKQIPSHAFFGFGLQTAY